jgi:hypothetical protein
MIDILNYFITFVNTILNFKLGEIPIKAILFTIIPIIIIFELLNIIFRKSRDK